MLLTKDQNVHSVLLPSVHLVSVSLQLSHSEERLVISVSQCQGVNGLSN